MSRLIHFDWAMKYLLRNKANFDILEGFLSELLHTDVKILEILESESNRDTADDKQNRLDLIAKTDQEERVLIEVQSTMQADFLSRILYGASRAVTDYLKSGQTYGKIGKVISVSIVYFDIGSGEDYLYHGTTQFRGVHCHDLLSLGENEKVAYGPNKETPAEIFPEYYLIKTRQFDERIQDKLDEWIYFFKNESIKPEFTAKGIHSAMNKFNIMTLNDEQRRAYDAYGYDNHYQASMYDTYYGRGLRDGRKKGEQQGREQGLKEGLKEGELKGIEKGHKEALLQVARSLKLAGHNIDEIAKLTQLEFSDLAELD